MEPDLTAQILAALARVEARLASLEERRPRRQPPDETADSRSAPARGETQPKRARAAMGGNEEENWLDVPEDKIAAVMAPFASEQRIKLLKSLYLGISESGQLKDFTGLTGGQLYHHLKELALAKFLSKQVRGEYGLSSFGYYAFSAIMILVTDLLAEDLPEELIAPEEIGQLD
ncbi:MAG: hypothetical protein ACM3X6_14970 [Patescibacteria group bacterium]